MIFFHHIVFLTHILSMTIFLSMTNVHADEENFEENITINLEEQYGKAALSLPLYQIDPVVSNDGRMNTYHVTSDIQNLQIYGNRLLLERLHEIEAIVALREIKDSEAYSKGLENAAKVPLTLTRNTIEDPVGTLEAIPAGVGNFLNDMGAAISGMGKSKKSEENSMLKDLVGFNTVKRRLASEIGVDPYSTNKILQSELDDVAWSMFAGGATIDTMMAAAPMAASIGMRVAEKADHLQADWKIPPATLIQAAEIKVVATGLTKTEASELLYHPVCSVKHLSTIVSAISEIEGATGKAEFLRLASKAKTEYDCRRNSTIARLLHHYHINNNAVQQIHINNDPIYAIDALGNQIAVVEADYFIWNQNNAKLLSDTNTEQKQYLLITGRASVVAKENLKKSDIGIYENTLKTNSAKLDVARVLLPDRAPDPDAVRENRTEKTLNNLTTDIGNVVDGILGGLTPQESESAHQRQLPDDQTAEE